MLVATPRVSDSVLLRKGLRICISSEFLGDAVGLGVGGSAYFEIHWLKVGRLWQGRSLSFLHSCIRNKLHLFVYIVTMAASTIQWQNLVVATNHMALKHKICV